MWWSLFKWDVHRQHQKNSEEITVYTAVEADQLKQYQEELHKAYPELKVKWVRDSTGVITAKLLAEQKNPQADVVFGVALTSLLVMEKKDMLEPFKPEGIQNLKPEFVSQKNCTDLDGYGCMGICNLCQ